MAIDLNKDCFENIYAFYNLFTCYIVICLRDDNNKA